MIAQWNWRLGGVLAAALAVAALPAGATNWYTIDPGDSGGRSSWVGFDLQSDGLHVLLVNDATAAAVDPTFVLTGMYFSWNDPDIFLGGDPVFGRGWAHLANGSTVINNNGPAPAHGNDPTLVYGQPAGGDVGGEWAYTAPVVSGSTPLLGDPGTYDYGISSSGMGAFGPEDLFNPSYNLFSPASPDGLQYGIAPTAGISPAANLIDADRTAMASPLIVNQVEFLLTSSSISGWSDAYFGDHITDVRLQYGTDFTDPYLYTLHKDPNGPPPVPEPITMVMLGCIGAGMLGARKLRAVKKQ